MIFIISLSFFSAVWNDKAVKLLFALYKEHQNDFKSTSIRNDVVWDKIRMRMEANGGYNFTRIQIKDKWMNMRKSYIRVKDHNKETGAKLKTYRYYNEMEDLYGNKPNVNPVAIASNMRAEDQDASAEESSTTDDDQHKQKKSKIERQLSSWTEKFIQHADEREVRREQRQIEKITAIENATKTFRDMMEKLIEKL